MKLFIWDFHGVLEKGTEKAALYISNLILKEQGFREQFTDVEGKKLFGLKWYKYFEYLLPNEDHARHLQLQELCFQKTLTSPEIITRFIEPNDNAYEVLEAISKKHTQILISNTKPHSLDLFIKAVHMEKYFHKQNAFAVYMHHLNPYKTKQHILKEYLSKEKQIYDDLIIIGDSPDDMSLKTVQGGTTYFYSYPNRPHREASADFKIDNLREVLKEV